MTEDKIEFIERDYGHCLRSEKPRLIKARTSSFNSIANRFDRFRINSLQEKLEKMKNDALTADYTNQNFSEKIEKKSKAIARLEEKIMLIAKEDVPNDYVSKRAIKLKKSMIKNLTNNAGLFYSIGLENKEEVFGNDLVSSVVDEETIDSVIDSPIPVSYEAVSSVDAEPVVESSSSVSVELPDVTSDNSQDENVEVVLNDLTRQSIADAVNAEFDSIDADKVYEQGTLSGEIEEYSNNNNNVENVVVNDNVTDIDAVASPVSREMTREEVRSAIEAAFGGLTSTPVNFDNGAIDDVAIREEVDDVIGKIRISRNNANSVRADKYDENGDVIPRENKYHYIPMTDEEIRESQRNLGLDANGNVVDSSVIRSSLDIAVPKVTLDDVVVLKNSNVPRVDSAVEREMPVVVADRDEKLDTYSFGVEGGENMFDIIDTTEQVGTVPSKSIESRPVGLDEYTFTNDSGSELPQAGDNLNPVSSKLDDYLSLKDKILHLQEQKRITQQKKAEAVRTAEETAERAQRVKQMFEESQRNYEQSLNMLSAYTTALEEECARNAKDAELAENDAKMSNNFIAVQQQKANDNYRVIEEIDGIINGGVESTHRMK